jgi:hypothetical protein
MKAPSVFAAESNLTTPASVCETAFNRGGTYWSVQEKSPVAEQAQGEQFDADQNRQGGQFVLHA